MDKTKVLPADNHAIMRDDIRARISLHDDIAIVGEASEGNEAVEKTRELVPDVIVMDMSSVEKRG